MKVIKHFRGSAFLYRPERAKAVTAFLSYVQFTVMFMLLRSAVIGLSFIYRLYIYDTVFCGECQVRKVLFDEKRTYTYIF